VAEGASCFGNFEAKSAIEQGEPNVSMSDKSKPSKPQREKPGQSGPEPRKRVNPVKKRKQGYFRKNLPVLLPLTVVVIFSNMFLLAWFVKYVTQVLEASVPEQPKVVIEDPTATLRFYLSKEKLVLRTTKDGKPIDRPIRLEDIPVLLAPFRPEQTAIRILNSPQAPLEDFPPLLRSFSDFPNMKVINGDSWPVPAESPLAP